MIPVLLRTTTVLELAEKNQQRLQNVNNAGLSTTTLGLKKGQACHVSQYTGNLNMMEMLLHFGFQRIDGLIFLCDIKDSQYLCRVSNRP